MEIQLFNNLIHFYAKWKHNENYYYKLKSDFYNML